MTSEETAVSTLLSQHPDAFVNAISDRGLFMPMPASVPVGGHPQLAGRSVLDAVVPSDRGAVITAWERTRELGGSLLDVTITAEPPVGGALHFFDLRPGHGVLLSVFVPRQVSYGVESPGVNSVETRPRFCRIRKSDVAILLDVDDAAEQMLGW